MKIKTVQRETVIRSSLLPESSFWRMIFINKSWKNSTDRDLYTPKSSKIEQIELFKCEKVFSQKYLYFWVSFDCMYVCRESCQSVKKVSRSWAMSMHYIYLHDKTTTVKKVFKISWIFPLRSVECMYVYCISVRMYMRLQVYLCTYF